MRWVFAHVFSIILIIGTSCQNNPTEDLLTEIPAAIILSTNNPTVEVGGEVSIVFAYILTEDGDTLGAGYPVRFEITAAPATSGPESPSFEYVSSSEFVQLLSETITNSNGRASVIFYSGTETGTVTIKATYLEDENVFVEESLITILPMPITRIVLLSDDDAIPHGGASTMIYAGIEDSHSDPAGEGSSIRLEIIDGPFANNEECSSFEYQATEDSVLREIELVADQNGRVWAEIFSGTAPGIVHIKATLSADTTIST